MPPEMPTSWWGPLAHVIAQYGPWAFAPIVAVLLYTYIWKPEAERDRAARIREQELQSETAKAHAETAMMLNKGIEAMTGLVHSMQSHAHSLSVQIAINTKLTERLEQVLRDMEKGSR
jgi:type II secretory pathway component PulM